MTLAAIKTDISGLIGTDEEAAGKLARFWQDADIHPRYPADTETVLEVMRTGGGFDVSAETLRSWIDRGMVPGVITRGGKLAWPARSMLAACIQADSWRRWLLVPRHIPRMSAVELAQAQAVAEGQCVFDDLESLDLCALVELLARMEDRAMRDVLRVAVRTKLTRLGALDQ